MKQQLWEATDTQEVWVLDTPHKAEISVVKQERMRGREGQGRGDRDISFHTSQCKEAWHLKCPYYTYQMSHKETTKLWCWHHSQSIHVNIVWKCSIRCMSNMPNKNVFRFVKTHAKENDTQITKQKRKKERKKERKRHFYSLINYTNY